MLFDPECNIERAILKESEQGILSPGVAREQIHRLREYGLTDEERRLEFLDPLDNQRCKGAEAMESILRNAGSRFGNPPAHGGRLGFGGRERLGI